jgi:hypothetical protein
MKATLEYHRNYKMHCKLYNKNKNYHGEIQSNTHYGDYY